MAYSRSVCKFDVLVLSSRVACVSLCRDPCEAGMASFCEELSAPEESPCTNLRDRNGVQLENASIVLPVNFERAG